MYIYTLRLCLRNNFNLPYWWMIHNTIKCQDNTYRCRHIQHDVITTYYHNPNPNHEKGIKCRARNTNPNPDTAIRRKRWRIAALGLGLGFLG